eukprot:Skav231988  [mRNA]  locus=scaffold719:290142:290528:- [translate_table: standard]
MASMASMENDRRSLASPTSPRLPGTEEESQPAEVWAEKTEEAMQHELSQEEEEEEQQAQWWLRLWKSSILQVYHMILGYTWGISPKLTGKATRVGGEIRRHLMNLQNYVLSHIEPSITSVDISLQFLL